MVTLCSQKSVTKTQSTYLSSFQMEIWLVIIIIAINGHVIFSNWAMCSISAWLTVLRSFQKIKSWKPEMFWKCMSFHKNSSNWPKKFLFLREFQKFLHFAWHHCSTRPSPKCKSQIDKFRAINRLLFILICLFYSIM